MPTDKQRRDAQRRKLQRQMERRREAAIKRRRNNIIGSVAGAIVLIAVIVFVVVQTTGDSSTPVASPKSSASSSASTTPTTPAPSSSAARVATYPCTWTKTPQAASKKATVPSTTTPPKTGMVTLSVATTQGPMTFSLNRAAAPCTVDSFVSLAQQGYFNSTPCHRLVTTGIYVLQCGDPSGTGSGGPGYSIPDEATGKETYPAGTIAMARTSDAHSGGSQFFIVYKDSPALAQNLGQLQYTVFGKVSAGLPVVDKVAAAGSNNANGTGDGKPKLPITLTTVTVKK